MRRLMAADILIGDEQVVLVMLQDTVSIQARTLVHWETPGQ